MGPGDLQKQLDDLKDLAKLWQNALDVLVKKKDVDTAKDMLAKLAEQHVALTRRIAEQEKQTKTANAAYMQMSGTLTRLGSIGRFAFAGISAAIVGLTKLVAPGVFRMFMWELGKLSAAFGHMFVPILAKATDGLRRINTFVTNLPAPFKRVAVAVTVAVAAFGAMAAIMAPLTLAVVGAIRAITVAVGQLTVATGVLDVMTGGILPLIGLIVTAVAGLGAGFAVLGVGMGGTTAATKGIQDAFAGLQQAASGLMQSLGPLFRVMGEVLQRTAESFVKSLLPMLTAWARWSGCWCQPSRCSFERWSLEPSSIGSD